MVPFFSHGSFGFRCGHFFRRRNRFVNQIVLSHRDMTSFRNVVLMLSATALCCTTSLGFFFFVNRFFSMDC